MEPIVVFLLSGAFSMSASIATSKLLKQPEQERPSWARSSSANRNLLIVGNLFALVLVASVWFGFSHLDWWIPLACLFITFPVLHVVVLERLLGAAKGVLLAGPLSLASVLLLWLYW